MIKNSATSTAERDRRLGGHVRSRPSREPLPPFAVPPAKSPRGKTFVKTVAPAPQKAPRIELPRQASVGEAFVAIGRGGLAHLRANEDCVRSRRDKEGIHQLRVSVRRLRSALALFRDLVPDAERRAIVRRLKWITRQCAEAREWDVFQDELLVPLRKSRPGDSALGDFAAEIEKLRRAADARVAGMLGQARYARNIGKIEQWWIGGGWRAPANTPAMQKAVDFSRARMRKFHRRLGKLGKRTDKLDEAGLHRLRIRIKKLRYAVDFLGGLFPGKATRAYRTGLVEIQDCLGALNDIAVARLLLAAVGRNAPQLDPAALARAGEAVGAWNAVKREATLKQLRGCWRRFADLRPFWK